MANKKYTPKSAPRETKADMKEDMKTAMFNPSVRKSSSGMRSMQKTALKNISPGMLKPSKKKK